MEIDALPVEIEAYSVIYTFDVGEPHSVRPYQPPNLKLWELTECYTDDGVKHRKYCAWLTPAQFERFVEYCDLYAEDVETMGSIGAPGFGIGWAPAIAFWSYDEYTDVRGSAYVTPVPAGTPPEDADTELDLWNQIKDWVVEKWG